jgi:heme/copper-type cytochrome/quinol oxidase subunit 2
MRTSTILPIIIFILVFLIGIVAIFAAKHRQKEIKKTGIYPEGNLMGRCIAIGIPLGIPIHCLFSMVGPLFSQKFTFP